MIDDLRKLTASGTKKKGNKPISSIIYSKPNALSKASTLDKRAKKGETVMSGHPGPAIWPSGLCF